MWRMIVLFPAPFGPTRPYTAPSGTVMFKLSRARKPSNCFTRFLTSIIVLLSFQALSQCALADADVAKLRDKLIELAQKLRPAQSVRLIA